MRTTTHSSPRPSKTAKKSRFKSIAGFTLAEVMIAFTVMVTGVAGSLTALASSLQYVDNARCSSLAAQISQSQIEKLRLNSWSALTTSKITPSDGSGVPVPVDALVPTANSPIVSRFTAEQRIRPYGTRPDMLELSITVTWKSMKGYTQSRTMNALYVKDGLYDCFKVKTP